MTWFDGAFQVNEIYEQQVPAMFVPNVFSFATEGKLFRYGSIRMPIDMWGPWRDAGEPAGRFAGTTCAGTVESMLRPEVVLDILQNFTLFATDKKHRRIKIICRYQQYFTTNQIVERVVKGYPKKGLIWHFQGSGKSLLMVFAAQKLRLHPKLGNPTVIIVVDRIDLDTQITATFNAADVPNMVGVATRQELQTLLGAGRAQGAHHHHPQIRRGGRQAERTVEHHRDGGRGAPHAGRRPRPQDARGAAECVPLRPHRHAHQPRRPAIPSGPSARTRTRRAT